MTDMPDEEGDKIYQQAVERIVELGNQLAEKHEDVDLWDIADGLLAGAVHYWLYSRQPCGDMHCEDCASVRTAEARMIELRRAIEQVATESEYFHTPNDLNAGRA